jgi:hypothetical protein
MPNLPVFKAWPEDMVATTTRELKQMYDRGFQGAFKDPAADEKVYDSLEWKDFDDAAHENGMAGDGKGKLSLAYECAEKLNPLEFPGMPQRTGCCVSRGQVNAFACSYAYEVWHGIPDDLQKKIIESGKGILGLAGSKSKSAKKVAERWPIVPHPKHQTFDHVVIYMERGHRGQGAHCGTLAAASRDKTGLLPRGVYDIPGYGKYDCSRYDDNMAARSGPRAPQAIRDFVNKHHVREITPCNHIEAARDALANNYGINVCSGYATSSRRPTIKDDKGNECAGANTWRGSWAHAMAWIGCDDRPWAHEKYGGPIFLVLNSWGTWNSGPRRIYGTDKYIPVGAFWITPRDARSMLRNGGAYVSSNVKGFPRREIISFW